VRGAPPAQAPRAARRAGDLDGARRRLRDQVSGLRRLAGVRARLLLAVLVALAVALAAMIAGFNYYLARSLSANATDSARARATAQLDLVRYVNGRLAIAEAADEGPVQAPVWIFAGARTLE